MIHKWLITNKMPSITIFTVVALLLLNVALALQETGFNNEKNGVAKSNKVPYERTFMKYHHRRKIHSLVSSDYEEYEDIAIDRFKRSLDTAISNQNADSQYKPNKINNDMFAASKSAKNDDASKKSIDTSSNQLKKDFSKSGETKKVEAKGYKVKAAVVPTQSTTTEGPKNICLHKFHRVSQTEKILSVVGTHSPYEERDDELMSSDKVELPGQPFNTSLPDGATVLVEECSHSCYTLWLPSESNTFTVLGQGCWQSSTGDDMPGCGSPHCAGTPASIAGAYFCCCSGDYCNHNMTIAPQSYNHVAPPKVASTKSLLYRADVDWSAMAAYLTLATVAILIVAAILKVVHARRRERREGPDAEKDGTSSDPEALATGLLCVDNLKLIEHIGQGRFGSVWRGALGSTPVAVKLYSTPAHWQREAGVYGTPLLAHSNILRYYGSDARPTLTDGGRQQLIVVELCAGTLRQLLQSAPLTWQQFAALSHGLASAVSHLHSVQNVNGVHKPCVVHRDINSNNVLVTSDGRARLADLGLAQTINAVETRPRSHRITEAGTLRYLAPEALEGALDLAGARAALCAVDVFALGLVLWEMLWRTDGAHGGATPEYAQPYSHAGLTREPTLTQMQALVSRSKVRPPLPRGPHPEPRVLKIAKDTCDECWDHDAEARLTAVCVEERLAELTQLLQPHVPIIHDNNLHPTNGPHDLSALSHPENDKNSNCTSAQSCDVMTPLLYAHPHIGRNSCLERNTHTNTQINTQLVHKSLKDTAHVPVENVIRTQNNEENCLSVARVNPNRIYAGENSDRSNDIRMFQRPLDYIPNDVSSHEKQLKQTNLLQDVKFEKPKWAFGRLFGKKGVKNAKCDTEVKLEGSNGNALVPNGKFKTSIVNDKNINADYANGRPTKLSIDDGRSPGFNFEGPCTLSPPNRTLSPTMMMESQMNSDNKMFAFKELPQKEENAPNQIFAVIVPKAKCNGSNLIEMHSKNSRGSSESIKNKTFSSQSLKSVSAGHSESEDSTIKKKRLSCDDKIITMNDSGSSSRASIEMELRYIGDNSEFKDNDSRLFDVNTDLSSSEDENLMLLSENGTKITMQPIPKIDNKKYQNDILKEVAFCNKFPKKGYTAFDNEFSDPHDKENLNGCIDNPVYLAALNGEITMSDITRSDIIKQNGGIKQRKCKSESDDPPKSPKPSLKYLSIKRQHSLEQVSEIFSSSGDLSHLQNPAGRVKTPGDLPAAVRRARRDRALQKGRAQEANRLSLYDDRMMFGNSL